MTRCLLVDDEPLALDILENYLQQVKGFEVVAKCKNAIEAYQILQKQSIDLIFLDIQMPQINGIEFVKTLNKPPKVIFTTAYRDFAVEGYELNAVDYLLKPIAFGRFIKALDKFKVSSINLLTNQSPLAEDPLLPAALSSEDTTATTDFLYVKTDKKILKIYLKDILYVESLKDYVCVKTKEKEIITKQKISYLEERLPTEDFLRIHRSYLVAKNKIEAFSPSYVEVSGIELPIGRSYKIQVVAALNVDNSEL